MNGNTLCAILNQVARDEPERVAIETWREGSEEKQLCYGELVRAVASASGFVEDHLTDSGNQVIGIVLDSSFATHIAIHAVMRLGCAALLLDPHWGRGTAATVLADSGVRVVVGSPPVEWDVACVRVLSLEEMKSWTGGRSIEDRSTPDDVAVVAYTSGSTSEPKRVPLTHANLLYAYRLGRMQLGLQEGARLGCLLRVASLGTLGMQFFFAQLHGGTTVLLPEMTFLNTPTVMSLAKEAGLDYLYLVPAVLRWINKRCRAGSIDRHCLYGVAGAPIEPSDAYAFRSAFEARLRNMYGLTECSFAIFFGLDESELDCTSIGAVVGFEADVVDESGASVPAGSQGEIVVSGPFVSLGYLASARGEQETFGKWFRTGDLGIRDENGIYYVQGRAKEMVIRGGFNIYYVEVEERARNFPGVIDCAAFKEKDPVKDEKLCLFVLADEMVRSSELRRYLVVELGKTRAPDEIVVQAEHALPLNRAGKVDRIRVSELFAGMRKSTDSG